MRQQNKPLLLQMMAYHLFGGKPWSEPRLRYWQLNYKEHIRFKSFHRYCATLEKIIVKYLELILCHRYRDKPNVGNHTCKHGNKVHWRICPSPKLSEWTHWGRDKIATISQTTFLNAIPWTKCIFSFELFWNMFPGIQSSIYQHWFIWWLGAKQATSHYLNHCWPSLLTHLD